jgi:putative transferase (TIGR04331 family)
MKVFLHISGLEKNINCKKYNNIILSWNLNVINNYCKYYSNKEVFLISNTWEKHKFKFKKKINNIRKILLDRLYKELNIVNKIEYSKNEWEILLEPWINIYLETNYFKWLLLESLQKKYKNFSYLKIISSNQKPFFDTKQYIENCFNNDIFNHLAFQEMLEFKYKNKNDKIELNKNFTFKEKFHYKKFKSNFFILLYEKIISRLKISKVLVHLRTSKTNSIKINFGLKNFPFKGIQIFERNRLYNIFMKSKYYTSIRKKINLNEGNSNNFSNYILKRAKFDLPRCFLEDFHNINKLHDKKIENINLVITDTIHRYNTIFKSWLAYKKNKNKNFKIVISDHGGIYGNSQRSYKYDENISNINFKFQKSLNKKQISLPSLFLEKKNFNIKRKSNILIICHDTTKYPKYFLTGPICEQIIFQYEQVKLFVKNFSKYSTNKIFIRPYLIHNGWKLNERYQKILKNEQIVMENTLYKKIQNESLIKIVTYPKTAYLECLINGPTFLLFSKKHYMDSKINEKFMNILFQNKLAFSDGKDLANHINEIENDILNWWQQPKIQKAIDLFIQNTNIYNKNPTSKWTKVIKKFL